MFVIISFVFIVKKIITYKIDYSILFNIKNIVIFIICCLVYSIFIVLNAIPWKNIVQILVSKKMDFITSAKVETKSNLMKYLPGNVFQYVGKNELALIHNISHISVASATVIDVIINLITVFMIIIIFYLKGLIKVFSLYGIKLLYLIFIAGSLFLILVILAIIFRRKIKKVLKSYNNLFKLKNIKILLKNSLFHFVRNIVNAFLFVIIFKFIVLGNLNIGLISVLGAFVLSWFIGFIMIGAPGGIGIREAVITFLLGNLMNGEDILLSIVIYRFVSIIGDILAFLLALFITKFHKKISK